MKENLWITLKRKYFTRNYVHWKNIILHLKDINIQIIKFFHKKIVKLKTNNNIIFTQKIVILWNRIEETSFL